jgi:site-specific DNA recombinase
VVKPGKPRAGIYARQSHAKLKSIEEQITECRRDADAQGFNVVEVYSDGESASRYAKRPRPDHARLLADLDPGGMDVVVMWESSRGDRDLTSWSAFLDLARERHVLIRVTDHRRTYDMSIPRDWRTLAEDGVDNGYESEKTRQRIHRSVRAMVDAGRATGVTPYGYMRRYDTVTREFIEQVPHPDQAPVVAEIVDRVADGETLAAIARDLNARGVPPPSTNRPTAKGQRWYFNSVRRIAQNEAYVGVLRHNGDRHDGAWPPIVDAARFYAAQRVLDGRKGQGWRSDRVEHLLTGIPTAEACGRAMAGRLERATGYRRYACRGCGCTYVDADATEALVLAYVLGRLARPDVYSTLRRAGEDADRELAAARAEAATLRARLDEWRESAVRGETSPASLATIEAGLTSQITDADRRAERAGVPPAVRALADARTDLAARWAAMPQAARRDVVAALVTVTVAPGRKGIKTPAEDRVRVAWTGTS